MAAASLSITDWTFEPTVVTGLIVLTLAYVMAVKRGFITRNDDVSAWLPGAAWRPYLYAAGMFTGFIALCSPIDKGGDEYFFWIHMIQHVLLMMVAPPLMLLGVAGMKMPHFSWWRRFDPLWRKMVSPWPALLIFTGVLFVWHIPQLYDTTLTVEPVHVFEHLTFIASGFIFWWPVVDPMRNIRPRPLASPMQKVALLTLAGIPATILGLIFSLTPSIWYSFYAAAPRLWGISALTDQQWAGAVMFGGGNVIYFIAVTAIFLRMFPDPAADEMEAVELGGEQSTTKLAYDIEPGLDIRTGSAILEGIKGE